MGNRETRRRRSSRTGAAIVSGVARVGRTVWAGRVGSSRRSQFWALTPREFWITFAGFMRRENRAKAEAIRQALARAITRRVTGSGWKRRRMR